MGPLAEAALEKMTFDRAFLGADGVTPDGGICEADLQQTRLKELMARRAEYVYVLAHGAKLVRQPFHAWAPLSRKWTLITDDHADSDSVAAFTTSGIEVVIVDHEGHPVR